MAVGRRVGRVYGAIASAITHQYIRKFLLGAVVEATRDLIDVVHAEENVVGARYVRIEVLRSVDRRVPEREMQSD